MATKTETRLAVDSIARSRPEPLRLGQVLDARFVGFESLTSKKGGDYTNALFEYVDEKGLTARVKALVTQRLESELAYYKVVFEGQCFLLVCSFRGTFPEFALVESMPEPDEPESK